MRHRKLRMKRSDQATYVPRPEQVITWSNKRTRPRQQDDRVVPSKKVAMPKPGIPPARIPEIAKRSRAGITSTNAHRSLRCAGHVKNDEVKRKWNISETYGVKNQASSNVYPPLSVLSCVLWQSSQWAHGHPSSLNGCLCNDSIVHDPCGSIVSSCVLQ